MAHDSHGIVDYLLEAGAAAEHLKLADLGIRGNGHALMLEMNSDEIAGALNDWLQKHCFDSH